MFRFSFSKQVFECFIVCSEAQQEEQQRPGDDHILDDIVDLDDQNLQVIEELDDSPGQAIQ